MYGIFTYIYHRNQPFIVGKYTHRPMDAFETYPTFTGEFIL